MAKWTQAELNQFGTQYKAYREAGVKIIDARLRAQKILKEELRYSESTMTHTVPAFMKETLAAIEKELAEKPLVIEDRNGQKRLESKPATAWRIKSVVGKSLQDIEKVIDQRSTPPAPVAPPPVVAPRPVVEEKPVDPFEEASAETLLLKAFAKMKAEVALEVNAKLAKILDLLTAPDALSKEVEEELMNEIAAPKRRPKIVIIGLLDSQRKHVANFEHHLKIKHYVADEGVSKDCRAACSYADAVLTMNGFISRDVENVVLKALGDDRRRWFPINGGMRHLMQELEKQVELVVRK